MRLIPKTHVSKTWGKARSWATLQTKPGRALEHCMNEGRFDVHHPDYVRFCAKQGLRHTDEDTLEAIPEESHMEPAPFDDGDAESMDDVMNMKLRDIITRFGEEGSFSAWLRDLKVAEDIREKRLKNEVAEKSFDLS